MKIKKILVVGDSWTYGSEIRDPKLGKEINDWDPENDEYRIPRIWPTKLARILQVDECTNLSYPAASNDRSVRVLLDWIFSEYISKNKNTDDLLVIVGLTSPERKEFYYKNDRNQNGFWMTLWPMWKHNYMLDHINKFADLYIEYFWNQEEYVNRYVNQLFYLQTVLEKYRIKYLMFQAFYQYQNLGFKNWKDNNYTNSENSSKIIWDLIDPIKFVNKNDRIHSFHNYIINKDATDDKRVALLDMHPSETGHSWWADYLAEYIKKHKII